MKRKKSGTVRIMRVAKEEDIGVVRKGKTAETAETKKRYSIWFELLSAQKSPSCAIQPLFATLRASG